jgi:hypothetical protein
MVRDVADDLRTVAFLHPVESVLLSDGQLPNDAVSFFNQTKLSSIFVLKPLPVKVNSSPQKVNSGDVPVISTLTAGLGMLGLLGLLIFGLLGSCSSAHPTKPMRKIPDINNLKITFSPNFSFEKKSSNFEYALKVFILLKLSDLKIPNQAKTKF